MRSRLNKNDGRGRTASDPSETSMAPRPPGHPLWFAVLGSVVAAVPLVPSQRPLAENITEYFKSRARSSRDRLATERRPKPTLQMPFVFMHQRKAGGSSMRSVLVHAAQQNNLTYWVPCYNKIGCENYDPPVDGTANNFAVFGAHTYWPGVKKALGIAQSYAGDGGKASRSRLYIAILTVIRRGPSSSSMTPPLQVLNLAPDTVLD